MAENFTQLSFAARLGREAAVFACCLNEGIALAEASTESVVDLLESAAYPADLTALAREIRDRHADSTGCFFDAEGEGDDVNLVVYTDDHCCVGAVADVIQATLARFAVGLPVVIEYAQTCSKPRQGEFGGGAVVVTADAQHWMSTTAWAERKAAELAGEAGAAPGGPTEEELGAAEPHVCVPVFILVYSHRHGIDITPYLTRREAEAAMAMTALSYWGERADATAPEDPLAAGLTDAQILAAYFDGNEREFLEIEEGVLSLPPVYLRRVLGLPAGGGV